MDGIIIIHTPFMPAMDGWLAGWLEKECIL